MSGVVASFAGFEIGVAAVEQLEVRAADEARDEDRVPAAAGVLGPHDPRAPSALRASASPRRRAGPRRPASGSLFSEHASSAGSRPRTGRTCCAPEVSSGVHLAAVPLPTACQWKPPSTPLGSATIFAANTCSLPRSPSALGPVSYQTVQATVSPGPVNVLSGSMPLRLGSTFSVGSPVADAPPSRRAGRAPTCCQQNDPHARGRGRLEARAGLAGRRLLDALGDEDLVAVPRAVDLAVLLLPRDPRHRVVARHGRAAGDRRVLGLRSVLMFSDGVPPPRSWPSGSPALGQIAPAARRSGWRRSASGRRAPCWARTRRPTAPSASARRSRSTAPPPRRRGRCSAAGPA